MIRRILIGLVAIGIVAFALWAPREEYVAADALELGLPPAVSFRTGRAAAAPPFVEGWDLRYPQTPAGVHVLTLQIGAVEGTMAPGRLVAGVGAPDAVLGRIAEVLGGATPAAGGDPPPATALDLRLELLGERLSAGPGEVGATVIAGAFVAQPAGDWRAFRMMVGENGPQCFLGLSEGARHAVLLQRAVDDGPALAAQFRALLVKPGAGTD